MSPSPEVVPETEGEPPRARGPILRYFDGEVALVKTFWLGGALASGLALMGYVGALIAHESLGALTTVLKYALFVLLFYLWVAVYGSAERYIRAQQGHAGGGLGLSGARLRRPRAGADPLVLVGRVVRRRRQLSSMVIGRAR